MPHPPSSPARPQHRSPLIGLVAALLLGPAALAQDAVDTGLPDDLEPPEEPIEQEPQPIPGLEEADFRIRPAAMLAEGTFISRRAGRVAVLPGGERAFVFSPDEQGITLRPMILMPSLPLQRMEQAMEDRNPAFLITGEIFAYLGVNYLLPTTFSIAPPQPATPTSPRGAPPPPPPTPPATADPTVEDLIRQLEQQRQRPRSTDPVLPGVPPPTEPIGPASAAAAARVDPLAAPAPAAAAASLIPEGQTLTRRRGRLIRLAAGEWAIAFDTGPQHDTMLDRPLLLLPSLNLQRLQGWAGRFGDAVPLEISGRITQYRGRNYLIPTLYRIYPVNTPLEPIQ
jgi:hypothetical protein